MKITNKLVGRNLEPNQTNPKRTTRRGRVRGLDVHGPNRQNPEGERQSNGLVRWAAQQPSRTVDFAVAHRWRTAGRAHFSWPVTSPGAGGSWAGHAPTAATHTHTCHQYHNSQPSASAGLPIETVGIGSYWRRCWCFVNFLVISTVCGFIWPHWCISSVKKRKNCIVLTYFVLPPSWE